MATPDLTGADLTGADLTGAGPAGADLTGAGPAGTEPAGGRAERQRRRVLQRVIFPGTDFDIVPLYAEVNPDRGAADLISEQRFEAFSGTKMAIESSVEVNAVPGETQSSIRFGSDVPARWVEGAGPRRSAAITEGRRVSFGTYFNAFPASYWRRWTTLDAVTLRLRVVGECTIIVYRSAAKGHSFPVETIRVAAPGGTDQPETIERTLSLTPFIDGGWYWFDIVAGPRGTTLVEAEWAAKRERQGLAEPRPDARAWAPGRVSIGFTTFNRPDFMIENLRTLGEAVDALDLVDAVYVIDQGTRLVTDHPDFADVAKGLGDRLQVIRQGNLGGSGGFSRVMDETARAGASEYLLILDDDIRLEPEGILRAATFADLTRRPTIVGGHMFSLYDRTVLHAMAEAITPRKWWWQTAPNTRARHDFGRRNLRNTPWLHRRAEADYNGWWMCLIPIRIIKEIGLGLPVFIKWDDAEYAVRAREAGYPTVSMPGVAAWHIPWLDKNDALDWQAYYHLRNRLLVALLHSPFKRGGLLAAESAERQLQALLSMQYSTAALRLMAIEDLLSGPDHLHRGLGTRQGELQEFRRGFIDAQAQAGLENFPPPRRKAPDNVKASTTPTNKFNLLTKAASATLRQFRRPRKGWRKRPQMALPYQDAGWWVLAKLDSAVVSAADGTSAAWYQRDPKLFRSLGWRTVILHARLLWRWPRLAATYRAALAEFTSPATWQETFAASLDDPPGGRRP
ncbi:MAG TPA: glycosyltransferase [Streptosporangiaceae bacterium]|nr:glycosyltransferase [Streptosporangiaceae bacterium]